MYGVIDEGSVIFEPYLPCTRLGINMVLKYKCTSIKNNLKFLKGSRDGTTKKYTNKGTEYEIKMTDKEHPTHFLVTWFL